ncbi:AMP-binding protein [Prosthecodimorpha staleyi]|uniref:3-methylmercaptopropionyl-CoA ligase n=1 Tax=Prosthecodimorpha staleyi TaxID=2840188 RepID=A0A947D587_9HYPH|nr:AMP-binding protein [Prosthecodimorpha staleyi]MBT9290995.1 AMP-binding protein [Prosthecodimorpha staleyi]
MRQDVSGWSVRWDSERASQLKAEGAWADKTIADYAEAMMASDPDRVLVIERERTFTVRMLYTEAQRLARALIQRGYRPGDTVSFQLPNWYETVVISLAAAMAGLVVHPLVPIYRDLEVGFMLGDSRSRLIFIPGSFRNFDYKDMMRRLGSRLPRPVDVVVLRDDEDEFIGYEGLLAEADPATPLPGADPDAVKIIMYTSGTTGRAKGVLHSHNSLQAENRMRLTHLSLTPRDVMFNPSPVTHVTGALYSLCLPFTVGVTTVMLDIWDIPLALDMMRRRQVNGIVAATIFLQGLVDEAKRQGESLPHLRFFLCGGAQVPPDLVREAAQVFPNCIPSRIYGSTEVPCITAGVNSRSMIEQGATTDGEIWLAEARIVDPQSGAPVEAGQEGEIIARAPQMFLGYARTEDNADAFDPDGFFKMGDLGRISEGRFVTVTGRKKDLIIRAGENISPKEIEDILFNHPAIEDIAIVAMPNERTGEAACAFVIPREGQRVDLQTLKSYLVEAGTAMQKIPERIEIVTEFPRTSVGKVRKDVLRTIIRDKLQAETAR